MRKSLQSFLAPADKIFHSFVICNEGYTIERYIHGWDDEYNDIQPWHQKDLVPAFGAQPGRYKTYQVRTRGEIEALFADLEFSSAPCFQVRSFSA